jgi:hypothetical protein
MILYSRILTFLPELYQAPLRHRTRDQRNPHGKVYILEQPVKAHKTMASTPEKKKEKPSALRSIIAGSTAGAVEIGTPTHCLGASRGLERES